MLTRLVCRLFGHRFSIPTDNPWAPVICERCGTVVRTTTWFPKVPRWP